MANKTVKKLGPGRITKAVAVGLFKNQSELADALKVTRGAVSNWPANKPIWFVHEINLRFIICPEKFKPSRLTAEKLARQIVKHA